MPQQTINIGTAPNDNTGDPLRTAFDKINNNFDEIYASGLPVSPLKIDNTTLVNTVPNTDTIIQTYGFGKVRIESDGIVLNQMRTPASSIGVEGDTRGQMIWSDDFIYVCIADYDGISSIWKRSPLTSW